MNSCKILLTVGDTQAARGAAVNVMPGRVVPHAADILLIYPRIVSHFLPQLGNIGLYRDIFLPQSAESCDYNFRGIGILILTLCSASGSCLTDQSDLCGKNALR